VSGKYYSEFYRVPMTTMPCIKFDGRQTADNPDIVVINLPPYASKITVRLHTDDGIKETIIEEKKK